MLSETASGTDLALRYRKVDVLVSCASVEDAIYKEQLMPEGIGYSSPVAGGSANPSTQRTNSSQRSEGARNESLTREQARPGRETRAEGGVDVQISERARAGAQAPQALSDTYEDPRARRRG